jgi:predicted O-methyltransferase YrrM
MKLTGKPETIFVTLARQLPDAPPLPAVKRKLLDYQMLALYGLARPFNRPGARILEIGTGHGGSGYMLAKAAPLARIASLTIDPNGAAAATGLWKQSNCDNIEAVFALSWDFLEVQENPLAPLWDMVFVDGDHNRIARDLPWFNRLVEGGLFLCHDYSPQDSPRPSAIVYAVLDGMAEQLGRPFDVALIDSEKTGMVGFYRRAGEFLE